MNLLVTGAAGYTGKGVVEVLAKEHAVRSFDIGLCEGASESIVGDIADLDACRGALDGIDAVVLCHMAKNPDGYREPTPGMDINVKGTANMYHAMAERGIKRAVLISSIAVLVEKGKGRHAVPGEGPYNYGNGLYPLSKILQECLARHYFEGDGIVSTLLRPSWICYENLVTKYGVTVETYEPGLVDPRDVGRAVHLALDLQEPALEAFLLMQDDAAQDLAVTHERLGWHPEHRFDEIRRRDRRTVPR